MKDMTKIIEVRHFIKMDLIALLPDTPNQGDILQFNDKNVEDMTIQDEGMYEVTNVVRVYNPPGHEIFTANQRRIVVLVKEF